MSASSRYIVVGGTGFIGRVLLERWPAAERRQVVAILRHSAPEWLQELGVAALVGGSDALIARPDLTGRDAVIINLARPDGDGRFASLTAQLADLTAARQCRRYVHVSSIDIYGRSREKRVDAATVPAPVTPYQREHAEAETVARSRLPPQQLAILRLGAVFGPGGPNLETLAREAMQAPVWRLLLRRFLYGRRRMYLVPAETAADAIRHLAVSGGAGPASALVLAEDDLPENNFAAVQDSLLAAFERPCLAWLPTLPPTALRLVVRLRARSASDPERRFDAGALRDTGFRRHADLLERLRAYAGLLRAQTTGKSA